MPVDDGNTSPFPVCRIHSACETFPSFNPCARSAFACKLRQFECVCSLFAIKILGEPKKPNTHTTLCGPNGSMCRCEAVHTSFDEKFMCLHVNSNAQCNCINWIQRDSFWIYRVQMDWPTPAHGTVFSLSPCLGTTHSRQQSRWQCWKV